MSLSAAVTQGTQPIRPCQKFEGHAGPVIDVIHIPGGQRIVTYSMDGSLRVWNLKTGKEIAYWRDGESSARAIALSPDGKKIVSGSDDGAVRLWNIDTGKVIAKWKGHAEIVKSVCWSRDAERVLGRCGHEPETVRVWDVESGKTVLEIETGLSYIWAAIYSPDTTKIATGGESKDKDKDKELIKIWDANTGKLVTNLKGHTRNVTCLAWTPDGSTLISGSVDYSIRMWNTTIWRQVAVLTEHTSYVVGIAISPNGSTLASASLDSTARLWNIENGQPISEPLQHADPVRYVSFSTDGKLLATGCHDKNAYSWDISVLVGMGGLDELPPDYGGKSLVLDADATRRPGQRLENARRLHTGFFADSPHYRNPSIRPFIFPSSAPHHTPPRPRLQNYFFNWRRRRDDEGIKLQERCPAVVDVPFAQGRPRNYTARELRMKKEREKARDPKNAKSASVSSSCSPLTKQSAGVPQPQPSLHVAVSTTPAVSATPAATTSATSLQDVIIPRAERWTRLWLFLCCISAHGHH